MQDTIPPNRFQTRLPEITLFNFTAHITQINNLIHYLIHNYK